MGRDCLRANQVKPGKLFKLEIFKLNASRLSLRISPPYEYVNPSTIVMILVQLIGENSTKEHIFSLTPRT
jgi:hypothetical protein